MSLVAALLSMGGSFALDSTRWWVFFVVAIPLTAVVVYVGLKDPVPKQASSNTKQYDELDSTWLEFMRMSY